MTCATGQFCDTPVGSCNVADATGTCVAKTQVCPAVYQPVCGCDGKAYPSDCDRMAAGVTKMSDGPCATADAGACPAGQTWCPGCTPGTGSCSVGGCPGYACPLPDGGTADAAAGSCDQVTTQAECDGRTDCHSVFEDPQTCRCAGLGCCMRFSRCAGGGRADCTGPAACLAPTPYCEGAFVLSYANSCYEGCVRQTACDASDAAIATPTCPQTAPTNGSSCGTSMACFYDSCPSAGRTQATCSGGSWAVQTAACGVVRCASAPGTVACPSGSICLVTTSGTISAQCVTNSCGSGPVTSACGTPLGGCTVSTSLTGGATITCNMCPQGGCA